ncbi:hypothetical protein PENFLA_c022G01260 [Penicillium flavigenum]|uniref:Uncharacterized protein n=1 Tax=Penicillium flavigenum TaxID=254877 RepID=A0A1V6SVU9_9EURO|nr:hypothetical protein PENFLA_c022G01260 [Penicillium flavigenum]
MESSSPADGEITQYGTSGDGRPHSLVDRLWMQCPTALLNPASRSAGNPGGLQRCSGNVASARNLAYHAQVPGQNGKCYKGRTILVPRYSARNISNSV